LASEHEADLCAALNSGERETLAMLCGKIAEQQGLTPKVHPGYRGSTASPISGSISRGASLCMLTSVDRRVRPAAALFAWSVAIPPSWPVFPTHEEIESFRASNLPKVNPAVG